MANEAVIRLKADNARLKSALTSSKEMLQRWSTAVKASVAGVAAFVATKLSVGMFKGFMALYEKQEQAETKLQTVLRATGNAAGFSADQLKQMASDLQGVTKFGDEVTLSAQAVLATFKEVKGDQFAAATEAAMDLSTVLGTDLQSSAMQLGKALNNPIRGVSALADAGVSFSEDQKQMIRALQESGDLAAAQGLILNELSSQFGGAARAAADTESGGLAQLQNRLGDIYESLGEVAYSVLGAMMPAFNGLATAAENVVPYLQLAAEGIVQFAQVAWDWLQPIAMQLVTQVIERFTAVQMVIEQLWSIAEWAFTNIAEYFGFTTESVQGGIMAIADFMHNILIGALVTVMVAIEEWRTVLSIATKSAALQIVRSWNQVIHLFTEIIPAMLSWVLDLWVDGWTNIANAAKSILTNIGTNISDFFNAVSSWLSGDGFNFEWTGLLEGFEATFTEMPKIAAREKSATEKALEAEINDMGDTLVNAWDAKWDELDQRAQANKDAAFALFDPADAPRVNMKPNVPPRPAPPKPPIKPEEDPNAGKGPPKKGGKGNDGFSASVEGLLALNSRITAAAAGSTPEEKIENEVRNQGEKQAAKQDMLIEELKVNNDQNKKLEKALRNANGLL